MIQRVDLIGFAIVNGPLNRSHSSYSAKASEWKGWTVAIEGPSVVFTGEGRRIEVPRARCVVASDLADDKFVGVDLTSQPKGKAK